MTSPAGHRLPGEGVWHPAGRRVGGYPAVYETWVRPDAVHTSLVVGVAWMDTRLLRATLYSGSTIPGGGPYRYTAPISRPASRSLVAAFNAGFLMNNANGGYYTDGKTILPLRNGAASFVIYRNGSSNIVAWGHGASLTPGVASVRQNLDLLVNNGKAVPGLTPVTRPSGASPSGTPSTSGGQPSASPPMGPWSTSAVPGSTSPRWRTSWSGRAPSVAWNWTSTPTGSTSRLTIPGVPPRRRLPPAAGICCLACSGHRTGTSRPGGHETSSPCPRGPPLPSRGRHPADQPGTSEFLAVSAPKRQP